VLATLLPTQSKPYGVPTTLKYLGGEIFESLTRHLVSSADMVAIFKSRQAMTSLTNEVFTIFSFVEMEQSRKKKTLALAFAGNPIHLLHLHCNLL
jgi:hypothetical protein